MTPEQQAMLATMYQADDDDISSKPKSPLQNERTRKIRVGAIEYEVPSVSYMARIEQTLAHHTKVIDQQRRTIERLTQILTNSQHTQRNQALTINHLRAELNEKPSYDRA